MQMRPQGLRGEQRCCFTPREITTSAHTHRGPHTLMARGRDGQFRAGRTDSGKPVSGLEGQGLHPELYFLAQAAHGHSRPLNDSHSCLSSKPSTWAPSIVLVHHRSHLPHAGEGGGPAGETLNLPWPESRGGQGGLLSPQDPPGSQAQLPGVR